MLMYIVIIVSCNSRMTNCTLQNRDVFQILGTDAGNPCVLEGFGFVTSPAVLRNSSCAAHQCRQWGTLPSLSGQSIPGKQWGGASRVADSLCCLLSCVWAAPSRAWSILSHTRTNHGRIRSSPALGGLTAFPSPSHLLLAQLDQRHAGLRSSLLAPHPWRDARTPARPRPAPRPLTAWSAQLAPLHPCCPGPAHRSASRWIPSFSPCFQGRRAPAAHWLLRSNRSGPPPPARVDDVTAAPEPPAMADVKVKPEVPDPMDIENRCCGRPQAGVEAAGRGKDVWRPRRTCFGAGGSRRGGALSVKAWEGWFDAWVLIRK